ncbi:MAG TPA: GNAT family N-acetyltransferase [Candidatus Saccharimonadaceae bacterium]|jgi:GNAT superfamily N-acetyltransferase|nr:GNAT family N-acetyltransferase [Candidatus Saccharimonadaceae bacterium]
MSATRRRGAKPAARTGARRGLARASASKRPARTPWTFHPLTPDRWDDLVRLFGPRGACAGCWCMFPRRTAAEWKAEHANNRTAFRKIVAKGDPPGLLAYEGGRAVGWVALAPRATYRRYESSRILLPVDELPTWSVPCFFIDRTQRGRRLTVALLEAACAYAAKRGAPRLEGYPVDPADRMPAAFVWHGLAASFRAAGFREVARRSATRPIMRRELAGVRSRRAGSVAVPRATRRVALRGPHRG